MPPCTHLLLSSSPLFSLHTCCSLLPGHPGLPGFGGQGQEQRADAAVVRCEMPGAEGGGRAASGGRTRAWLHPQRRHSAPLPRSASTPATPTCSGPGPPPWSSSTRWSLLGMPSLAARPCRRSARLAALILPPAFFSRPLPLFLLLRAADLPRVCRHVCGAGQASSLSSLLHPSSPTERRGQGGGGAAPVPDLAPPCTHHPRRGQHSIIKRANAFRYFLMHSMGGVCEWPEP